jgi:AraC-like DNA-binding protein
MAADSALYRLEGIGEVAANVRTNYAAPPHAHETYSIGIFRGPARIWCRGRAWELDSGSIALLEPREVHRGTALSRQCTQDAVLPDPAFMVAAFGSEEPFAVPEAVFRSPGLAIRLSAAAEAREAGALAALLVELFARRGRSRPAQAAGLRGAGLARAMTAVRVEESVAAASHASGISRSHFSRKMRALSGLSPRDLRRQMRVARARALIESGTSLAAAAAEAGFADQAHMTRQLRSLLGVTPAALREGRRK